MAHAGRPTDAVKARYARILEESGAYERFYRILKQTEKDDNFLKAFEMAEDRASGKAIQRNENRNIDDDNRPSTESLITTIRDLRKTIEDLRNGVGLERKE